MQINLKWDSQHRHGMSSMSYVIKIQNLTKILQRTKDIS